MTPEILEDRLIDFASRIIGLAESLPKSAPAQHISKQMYRAGTSPALNYGEARAAESRKDFAHKMKICLKELRETLVCLKIIVKRSWVKKELIDLLKKKTKNLFQFLLQA